MKSEMEREVEYQALRRLIRSSKELESSRMRRFARAMQYELTPCQRKYILMYYQEQMRMQDIAAAAGVTTPTVSRTISRGVARLERCMRYEFPEAWAHTPEPVEGRR